MAFLLPCFQAPWPYCCTRCAKNSVSASSDVTLGLSCSCSHSWACILLLKDHSAMLWNLRSKSWSFCRQELGAEKRHSRPTRSCSCKISQSRPTSPCWRCSSTSMLASRRSAWCQPVQALLLWSMIPTCRPAWPCPAYKTSRSPQTTRCVLHMPSNDQGAGACGALIHPATSMCRLLGLSARARDLCAKSRVSRVAVMYSRFFLWTLSLDSMMLATGRVVCACTS